MITSHLKNCYTCELVCNVHFLLMFDITHNYAFNPLTAVAEYILFST